MRGSEFVALPEVTDHTFASRSMVLNFTAYNRTACRTLVPWRVHGVNPPDITFRDSIIVHVYIASSVFACALCCFKNHVSAKKCLHNTFPGMH